MWGALSAAAGSSREPAKSSEMLGDEADSDGDQSLAAPDRRSSNGSNSNSASYRYDGNKKLAELHTSNDARKRLRGLNMLLSVASRTTLYSLPRKMSQMRGTHVSLDTSRAGLCASAKSSASEPFRTGSINGQQSEQQQLYGIHLLCSFYDYCSLASVEDNQQSQACVQFMSMHTSKGKEFACVALPHLHRNPMPMIISPADEYDSDIGQELNLLYVAMTRARDHLLLSWPRQIRYFGKNSRWGVGGFSSCCFPAVLSQFLTDVVKSAEDGMLPGIAVTYLK